AEDHDYQEIESASVLDKDAGLMHLRVDLSNPESSPVGWLKLREDVSDAVSKCFSGLPNSEFQPDVRNVLEASYKPGVSPVDAFLKTLEKLFEGTGLLLAHPLQS